MYGHYYLMEWRKFKLYLSCQYWTNDCFSCYKFIEVVILTCSVKKVFLEISQNSQENTCARGLQLYYKKTLAQVFSCGFYEIFKNTFSCRTTPVAVSVFALYLCITHHCIFFIFHQVVRKPFKFINNGLAIKVIT